MAEHLISQLKIGDNIYVLKDAEARKNIESKLALYLTRIDLSKNGNATGISADEISYDNAVNAYKCKGNITVAVPHTGTYLIRLTTTNYNNETIEVNGENLAVSNTVVFLELNVSSIAFTANDYIWIKEILINETIMKIPENVSELKNDAEYLSGEVNNENLKLNIKYN